MIQHPARPETGIGLGSSHHGEWGAILQAPPAPCLPHPPSQRGAGRLSCPGCGDELVDGVCGFCQEQPFLTPLELRQKWWPL